MITMYVRLTGQFVISFFLPQVVAVITVSWLNNLCSGTTFNFIRTWNFLDVSCRIITILPIRLTRGSGHLCRTAAGCVFCHIITVNRFFFVEYYLYMVPLLLCYVILTFANWYAD